jgi:mono/diheme cytochrome c family protein
MAHRSRLRTALLLCLGFGACFAEPTEAPPSTPPAISGASGQAGENIGGDEGGESGDGGRSGRAGGGAGNEGGDSGAGNEAGSPPEVPLGTCVPARASELLPARDEAMSAAAQSATTFLQTQFIFREFRTYCGACHFEQPAGQFQIKTIGEFIQKMDADVLAKVKSENADEIMPPGGLPWSQRLATPDDAIRRLIERIESWIAAGKPPDLFEVPNPSSGPTTLLLPPAVGNALTNIGSCVPEPNYPFGRALSVMDGLDLKFEAMERSLPGVGTPAARIGLPERLSETDLSTFDSDELAKNGVIAFAPAYPLWSDGSGKLRHVRVPRGQSIRFDAIRQEFDIPPNTRFYKTFLKKIKDKNGSERFRKIETRLILARPDSATGAPTALYGAYEWNENETEATLVTDPLRNGEPFKDHLLIYIQDEPLAAAIRAQDPLPRNLTFEFDEQHVHRRYAIPGSERCVQCHMGSPSSSFVLGFTPLQIKRRPLGEGGVFEPAGADELNQLERLIELGVITGVASADEILPLEESQGEREPRNDRELVAQAYMFGNCGHCHNPRGFATASAPELGPLLDFWPRKDGGIFQFPIDRKSSRVTRGAEQTPIHYITPSLRDRLPAGYPADTKAVWSKKWDDGGKFFEAPWRSLIYRNVHTPFTYGEDFAIYPHMPLNTAGFDCRAFRFLGEWMVSIPAVRTDTTKYENSIPVNEAQAELFDNSPQPYAEVFRGDPGYEDAVEAAEQRLQRFVNGDHYTKTCPDGFDTVDPYVERGTYLTPLDTDPSRAPLPVEKDSVPHRPHWVSTDLSDPPGDWIPRRDDWSTKLVDQAFEAPHDAAAQAAQEHEKMVVELLQNAHIDAAFRAFATKKVPLAAWAQKEGCNFQAAGVRKASEYGGSERYDWMDQVSQDAPIFESKPGAAVFDMICVNCHGRNFDSRGRQAETIQIITGGETRVANFLLGLVGPPENPGGNIARVFSVAENATATAEDWAGRYLAWMALGGTKRRIPREVLSLVSQTGVAGTPRQSPLVGELDEATAGNMLGAAVEACRRVLPFQSFFETIFECKSLPINLIMSNGDGDLWKALCTYENPGMVRVLRDTERGLMVGQRYIKREAFPAGTRVGNHCGVDAELTDANPLPWCVLPISAYTLRQEDRDRAQARIDAGIAGVPLPVCPDDYDSGAPLNQDFEHWATRGAINAGLATFVYLEQVGHNNIDPRYDECEKLGVP